MVLKNQTRMPDNNFKCPGCTDGYQKKINTGDLTLFKKDIYISETYKNADILECDKCTLVLLRGDTSTVKYIDFDELTGEIIEDLIHKTIDNGRDDRLLMLVQQMSNNATKEEMYRMQHQIYNILISMGRDISKAMTEKIVKKHTEQTS